MARALLQARREVLLLESSDWPYMVAKDRARDYAIDRFRTHLERFKKLAAALESGEVDGIETALSEIEEADNLFAKLDLGVVSGHEGPAGP
jgi:1,4-alpha-glucan branching enzyme